MSSINRKEIKTKFGEDTKSFTTRYFVYSFCMIDKVAGWRISAIPGLNRFESPEYIKGYPVIDMSATFMGYTYDTIDISDVNTSHVRFMNETFKNSKLRRLDLSDKDLGRLTSAVNIMQGCYKLEEFIIREGNFYNLQYMTGMFARCINLLNVELSLNKLSPNYKKSDIKYGAMFYDCALLNSVDLRGLTLSKNDQPPIYSDEFNRLRYVLVDDEKLASAIYIYGNGCSIIGIKSQHSLDKMLAKADLMNIKKIIFLCE